MSRAPVPPSASPQVKPESTTVDQAQANDTASQSTGFTLSDMPEIAGYVLSHEIARGGMGRVLAGRELSLEREVAIKTLLPRAVASRFITESRITSQLPHPGIPPIYSLGTMTDGSPYLAMKLVRGRTLAAELDARPDPLHDLPRFLLIFEQIAQAVGFAHAQGIVHRDLKPANVMVGAYGEVQVMDWGLAKKLDQTASRLDKPQLRKATGRFTSPLETVEHETDDQKHDQTREGDILGTPAFMAPEQARAEQVGFTADVFSLGGILCAILTGKAVFAGKSGWEALQLAAAGNTTEAIDRLEKCGADAELIKLAERCLSVDKTERPADGQEVAHLVAAYRHSVDARLKKAETERAEAMVRESEQQKRRRQFVAAVIIVIGVLVAGIIGTTIGYLRAEEKAEGEQTAKLNALAEKSRAVEAKEHAVSNLNFARKGYRVLGSVFENVNPEHLPNSKKSLRETLHENLRKAVKDVSGLHSMDPLTVAEIQHILGTTLLQMGDYALSSSLFEKVHATHLAEVGLDHSDTLTNMSDLALSYELQGKLTGALQLQQKALPFVEKMYGLDDRRTLTLKANIANVLISMGRHQEARMICEEVLRLRIKRFGPDHEESIDSLNNLAMCISTLETPDKATSLFEEAHKRRLATLGPNHPQTLVSMNNLGKNYLEIGKPDQAIPLLQKAAELQKQFIGADHPDRLTTLNTLAVCLQSLGKHDLANKLFAEVLNMRRVKLGEDHPETQGSRNNLAAGYFFTRQFDKAIPLFKEALGYQVKELGRMHEDSLLTIANLGIAYREMGQYPESISYLKDAFENCDKVSGLYWVGIELYVTYVVSGNKKEAEKHYQHLLSGLRQKSRDDQLKHAAYWAQCGLKLLQKEHAVDAEPLLRECLAVREQHQPKGWTTFAAKSLLGCSLLKQKKYGEAEKMLLGGYRGMKEREEHIPILGRVRLTEAVDHLIRLYTETNEVEKTKKWQQERERYKQDK